MARYPIAQQEHTNPNFFHMPAQSRRIRAFQEEQMAKIVTVTPALERVWAIATPRFLHTTEADLISANAPHGDFARQSFALIEDDRIVFSVETNRIDAMSYVPVNCKVSLDMFAPVLQAMLLRLIKSGYIRFSGLHIFKKVIPGQKTMYWLQATLNVEDAYCTYFVVPLLPLSLHKDFLWRASQKIAGILSFEISSRHGLLDLGEGSYVRDLSTIVFKVFNFHCNAGDEGDFLFVFGSDIHVDMSVTTKDISFVFCVMPQTRILAVEEKLNRGMELFVDAEIAVVTED